MTQTSQVSYNSLPHEIRYLILSYTDIVVRERPDQRVRDYVRYQSNAMRRMRSHLIVSKQFATDARYMFFTANRFAFRAPNDCLEAFRRWGPKTMKLLRKFHFELKLSSPVLETGEVPDYLGWERTIDVMVKQCDLPQLELSIDTGVNFQTLYFNYPRARPDHLKDCQNAFIEPLLGKPSLRQLKSFFVFWCIDCETEADAERMVMGSDYDSVKLGKIPYQQRHSAYPFGPPLARPAHKNGAWPEPSLVYWSA